MAKAAAKQGPWIPYPGQLAIAQPVLALAPDSGNGETERDISIIQLKVDGCFEPAHKKNNADSPNHFCDFFSTTHFLRDSLFELNLQSGGFYSLLLLNNHIFENRTSSVPLSVHL